MKSEATISLDWGKIKFFLGEVFRNFTRNAGMQITAIGTVAVTIVLLGVFLYVRAGIAHLGSDVFSQITISVYLKSDATSATVSAVRTALAEDDRIASAQYIPKKEGLRELRDRMKGQIDTSILTENPLPDKFRVSVRDPDEVPAVAAHIRKIAGVENVDYGQDVVQRLLQLAGVAHRVGLAVIAVSILVAGIIISNTIRLTVFARRREISIMQLVGATNMYIRMPFICEGLLDGLAGAAVAILLLTVARASLVPKLITALPWIQTNVVQVDLSSLVLQLLAVGAAVGIVASWISVGRFLRT
jgi:cell division transport system permease protein